MGISGTVPTTLGGALSWIATGGVLATLGWLTSTVSVSVTSTVGSTAVGFNWWICQRQIIPGATCTSYISGPVLLTISPERHFRSP